MPLARCPALLRRAPRGGFRAVPHGGPATPPSAAQLHVQELHGPTRGQGNGSKFPSGSGLPAICFPYERVCLQPGARGGAHLPPAPRDVPHPARIPPRSVPSQAGAHEKAAG